MQSLEEPPPAAPPPLLHPAPAGRYLGTLHLATSTLTHPPVPCRAPCRAPCCAPPTWAAPSPPTSSPGGPTSPPPASSSATPARSGGLLRPALRYPQPSMSGRKRPAGVEVQRNRRNFRCKVPGCNVTPSLMNKVCCSIRTISLNRGGHADRQNDSNTRHPTPAADKSPEVFDRQAPSDCKPCFALT